MRRGRERLEPHVSSAKIGGSQPSECFENVGTCIALPTAEATIFHTVRILRGESAEMVNRARPEGRRFPGSLQAGPTA